MKQAEKPESGGIDKVLLVIVFLLVITGLVILYSTSSYNGRIKFGDSFYYLKKQIFATTLGIAGMYAVAKTDYHVWAKLAVPGYILAIVLCIAVMLFGDEYNGSKRWLSLGPFSFQPSEYVKVALIVFLAWLVTRNAKKIGKLSTLFRIMLFALPVVGLVGASNLSTAVIILGIAVILIFTASPKYGQFIWMAVTGPALWQSFSAWKVTVWSGSRSGRIRRSMRKDIRPFRGFTPSDQEDCSGKDLEAVSRSWVLSRRRRTI